MDSLFHKMVLAALIAGLCVVLAVIWYCLFGASDQGAMDGTLVRGLIGICGMGGGKFA